MDQFRHLSAGARLYYGAGALKALPSELDRVASARVAVLVGSSVAASADLMDLVATSVGNRPLSVLTSVRAQSPVDSVFAAAKGLRESKADALIAVGGGSAIVTARAANILASEDRCIDDLCSRLQPDGQFSSPKLSAPKLPQFVIPTTPTTAMYKAGSAVVEGKDRRRHTMFDPKTRARAIFIHPEFSLSAPTELVETASFNALAMAVEGLVSDQANPISDAYLMQSLRLLSQRLPTSGQRGVDSRGRGELMLAALLCGQGTDDASPGLAAALGHTLGERFNVANGAVNAVLLPHTMRFNLIQTADRLPKIAEALGASGTCAISAVETLLRASAAPSRLRDLGVPQSGLKQIPELAANDWFFHKNPRRVESAGEIAQLLQFAW
ncbi:Iron-containing alcohol dehydrogenase [Caballeronia calidae]|uniref:Iron-containing alcohol dehydrogenase n=1 Tax=Caballeronia calidae TaxID=1777139 RepID=A0A158EFC4_9BURK|nr:iron-containing alcohol dehydrogenase family protein [Caballeronia calidae]SAL05602.1 Iron-containing alcohol dehydrogenase [Caballeronia calidae]